MKHHKIVSLGIIIMFAVCLLFTGCQTANISNLLNSFSIDKLEDLRTKYDSPISYVDGFSSDIGVVSLSEENSYGYEKINAVSALLVDITDNKVLFSKYPHMRLYPASTTKIMTALLALELGDTKACGQAGEEVVIEGEAIMLCDYRVGDTISFDTALHGTLMKSGNDAAAFLSTFVTKDMSEFVAMMNERAKEIGATNTHFANPHGLHDLSHYTTAYDLYLMFNEAIKNKTFRNTIREKSYFGTLTRTTEINTYIINAEYTTNNEYLNGKHAIPAGVTILGGKSGFTNEATSNYICLFRKGSHEYIVCVMGAPKHEQIYEDMDYLMNSIEVDENDYYEETETETASDSNDMNTDNNSGETTSTQNAIDQFPEHE